MSLIQKNTKDKNEELSTNQELLPILKKTLNYDSQMHYNDWLFGCKPNEKKGLFLLGKIYDNRGLLPFKTKEKKDNNIDIANDLTYKAAIYRYNKRSNLSTYKNAYDYTNFENDKSNTTLYKNIFQERNIDQLPYSQILNISCLHALKNWLAIEHTEEYKDLVLEFLRSFYTTVKFNSKDYKTTKHMSYTPFKEHELYSNKPFFDKASLYHNANSLSKNKGNKLMTMEEMRNYLKIDELKNKLNKNIELYEKTKKQQEVSNMDHYNMLNKKKEELIRGNCNLLKGIYGNTNSSVYQENFKGHNEKFKIDLTKGKEFMMYTSGVKGKMPDPAEMNRINTDKYTISNTLKNNISSIINV